MENEKRLIDADALISRFCELANRLTADNWFHLDAITDEITDAPTVDAVEVVRCKDCKHKKMTPDNWLWCNAWCGINGMGDEGFCNYGERRTE